MKKFVLLCAIPLVLSGAVWASPLLIHFTGTGPFNYLGEPSYPYWGTVGNTSKLTGPSVSYFMCLNNNLSVSYGETWLADEVWPTTPLLAEAGWLFEQALHDYSGGIISAGPTIGGYIGDGSTRVIRGPCGGRSTIPHP